MYHKILVPLDGSPFSARVLPYLTPYLTPWSEIHLLHVREPQHGPQDMEAEDYIQTLRGELRSMGTRTQGAVRRGDVTSVICEYAQTQGMEMIAMATHGRSGVNRWALGSTADHILRRCTLPTLLVRPASSDLRGTPILQRILVPLDGSSLAEHALATAQKLAKASGASLLLLRAIDLQVEQEIDGPLLEMAGQATLRRHRAQAANHYLTQIQYQLRRQQVDSQSHVMYTRPHQAILATAKSAPSDLIVMSTHARSLIGRWVYGSVADQVVREAPCPLLLTRGVG